MTSRTPKSTCRRTPSCCGLDQQRDDIVIRLPRAGVLAGRVIDEHGEPVSGSLVQALQYGRRVPCRKCCYR